MILFFQSVNGKLITRPNDKHRRIQYLLIDCPKNSITVHSLKFGHNEQLCVNEDGIPAEVFYIANSIYALTLETLLKGYQATLQLTNKSKNPIAVCSALCESGDDFSRFIKACSSNINYML